MIGQMRDLRISSQPTNHDTDAIASNHWILAQFKQCKYQYPQKMKKWVVKVNTNKHSKKFALQEAALLKQKKLGIQSKQQDLILRQSLWNPKLSVECLQNYQKKNDSQIQAKYYPNFFKVTKKERKIYQNQSHRQTNIMPNKPIKTQILNQKKSLPNTVRCKSSSTYKRNKDKLQNPSLTKSLRGTLKSCRTLLKVSPSTNVNQKGNEVFQNQIICQSLRPKIQPIYKIRDSNPNQISQRSIQFIQQLIKAQEEKFYEKQMKNIEILKQMKRLPDFSQGKQARKSSKYLNDQKSITDDNIDILRATYLYDE